MKGNMLRKILILIIFVAPAVSYTGCKKQAKCGCGKDVLFTLTNEPSHVMFNETYTSIQFSTLTDPYSTYNFCNPSEMKEKLADYKTGDELLVSGHVYWNCSYVNQSSNSSYGGSYYRCLYGSLREEMI
jgi:predicted small secreted protein